MDGLVQRSIEVIRENQFPSGAYIASPSFSQYGYSWFRDGMWIAYSMDCVGEHDSATAFHRWAAATVIRYEAHILHLLQKIDNGVALVETDYLPTRFHINGGLGDEEWPDFQLDGYGAWLWGAVQHCQHYNPTLWDEIRPAIELTVQYLAALWQSPNYDCWEEFRDQQHTATLATIYSGLYAVQQVDPQLVPTDLPEKILAFLDENCVSESGHFVKFIGNDHVDASLLWLAVPFEMIPVTDERFIKTLQKIEQDILHPKGGVYRYAADTYYGGGEWLLLTSWLAWTYLRLDRVDDAHRLVQWVKNQANDNNEMPEQVNTYPLNASYYQPWVNKWGVVANPLLWSHAMYLIVETEMETRS